MKTVTYGAVLVTVLAGALGLAAPAQAGKSATNWACEAQQVAKDRAECRRYARRGELSLAPRAVSQRLTDGPASCWWRHDGQPTIVFCLNGRRYEV